LAAQQAVLKKKMMFSLDAFLPLAPSECQDPRGAPDPMPLWTVLDMTPGGRGTDWYPKLEYGIPPMARVLRT
jgi:predicted dithiol-disulfide oxidoreductase (DUF899 family)